MLICGAFLKSNCCVRTECIRKSYHSFLFSFLFCRFVFKNCTTFQRVLEGPWPALSKLMLVGGFPLIDLFQRWFISNQDSWHLDNCSSLIFFWIFWRKVFQRYFYIICTVVHLCCDFFHLWHFLYVFHFISI
jgi:hypothetical protein